MSGLAVNGTQQEKPATLLPPQIANGPQVRHSRQPLPIAGTEARGHGDAENQSRPRARPLDALGQHEERIVSSGVVGPAVLERVAPRAIRRAGWLVLDQADLREGACAPPVHVGLDLIDGVPSRRLKQRTDLLPAFAAVDLGGASNMKRRVADRLDP